MHKITLKVMKYSKRLIAVGDEHEIKIPDELQ
jgi:hypothetical protein